RQQTTRLKSYDRNAAHGERRKGRDQSIQLVTGVIDKACGEESAPATQRTALIGWPRNVHAVSAGDQHLERGVEIFALVSAVEGVSEQNDFMPIRSADNFAFGREHVAPPFRQRALGADPGDALEQRAQ